MLAESEMRNPSLDLRPGMYANARIGIERKENALLVPAEALLMEKSSASVFTVTDKKARKRPVKIGFNDGIKVEIMEGIKQDEAVILLGKTPLSDGRAVNVTEGK
jgi:multidrug efflux pump subunit AcrA (membrane-fusion protein)